MKKVGSVAAARSRKISEQKLIVGLDLGDRSSWYCVLDESGRIVLEQRLSTTPKAMREVFGGMPRSRVALETGMHSPWASRLLSECGHDVIVAHARSVRLIGESRKKDDRLDAQTLARLARIDPELLCPSQREGTGGSEPDPGASRTGAGTHGTGEHGPRTGEELRGAAARLQCTQYESGKSGMLESGIASGAGATVERNRVVE